MNMDMESINVTDMDLRVPKNPGVHISTLPAFKPQMGRSRHERVFKSYLSKEPRNPEMMTL